MIRLSGLTVRNEGNPDGDIEIRETGLRPGEKLFEELMIDSSAQPTAHARIYSAEEEMLPWGELEANLRLLKDELARGDVATVVAAIGAIVPAYHPDLKSVVEGKRRAVCVDLGGHRTIKKNTT